MRAASQRRRGTCSSRRSAKSAEARSRSASMPAAVPVVMCLSLLVRVLGLLCEQARHQVRDERALQRAWVGRLLQLRADADGHHELGHVSWRERQLLSGTLVEILEQTG